MFLGCPKCVSACRCTCSACLAVCITQMFMCMFVCLQGTCVCAYVYVWVVNWCECACVFKCVCMYVHMCMCVEHVCVVLCMHRWTCMCSHIYAGLGMGRFNGKSFGIRQIWVQILTLQFISYMSPCYSPPWLPPLQDGMIPPFS